MFKIIVDVNGSRKSYSNRCGCRYKCNSYKRSGNGNDANRYNIFTIIMNDSGKNGSSSLGRR